MELDYTGKKYGHLQSLPEIKELTSLAEVDEMLRDNPNVTEAYCGCKSDGSIVVNFRVSGVLTDVATITVFFEDFQRLVRVYHDTLIFYEMDGNDAILLSTTKELSRLIYGTVRPQVPKPDLSDDGDDVA